MTEPIPNPNLPVSSPQPTMRRSLDVGAILTEAWSLLMRDLGLYVAATLVHTAIVLVTCGLGIVFAGPLFGGLIVIAFKGMKDKETTFDDTFAGFRFFGSLLLLSLVAMVLIFLGLLLCVLPGLYLFVAWIFAPFLIVDRDVDFWDAMGQSMRVVNENLGSVLLVVLVACVINALGGLVVLGFLVTQPLMITALAATYRRLFGLSQGAGTPAPNSAPTSA